MKRWLLLLLTLGCVTVWVSAGTNYFVAGLDQYGAPPNCGTNGQVLTSNGTCGTTWTTSEVPSDTAYNDVDNNWSATQTFQSSITVISGAGSATAGMNAPNGQVTFNLMSGANAAVRILGGSGNILYVGEISGKRGLFDGNANALIYDGGSGNGVINNLTVSTVTFSGGGAPPNSQALCLLGGQLGHCTGVVGVGGGCTCVAP
jgi:hypothetical protein